MVGMSCRSSSLELKQGVVTPFKHHNVLASDRKSVV